LLTLKKKGTLIDDKIAVTIAAILGTKGPNYMTCDVNTFTGDNVMSIAYAPGQRDGSKGHFYIAWEQSGAKKENWRPAACSPYIKIDMERWSR